MPTPGGDSLHDQLAAAPLFYQQQALSTGTQQTYASGLRCFKAFCALPHSHAPGGLSQPPSQDTMDIFVSYCAGSLNLGYSTIKSYVCAIRNHFIVLGYEDLTLSMPRLQLTLRGIKKSQAPKTQTRLPLTAAHMRQLQAVLASSHLFEDVMLWAALCLGFFGAFRAGEFTCKTETSFDCNANLSVSDISFSFNSNLAKHCVHVHLKASKTDPFRQGVDVLLFETGQPLCPYLALSHYLTLLKSSDIHSPLFVTNAGLPLTRSKFVLLLREAASRAGLPAHTLNGHSLRKGFATSCSAAKIPDHVISSMGRWSSDCYKLYISTPLSVIANAHLALAAPSLPLSL